MWLDGPYLEPTMAINPLVRNETALPEQLLINKSRYS